MNTEQVTPPSTPTPHKLKEKIIGYFAIYVGCCFFAMLASLAFTEVATYPLSLFYGNEVVCETFSHSYKPGQSGIYYEYFLLEGSTKEYIPTLVMLGITGLYYLPWVILLLTLAAIKSHYNEIKESLESSPANSLKAVILTIPKLRVFPSSIIVPLTIAAWFYRHENSTVAGLFQQLGQFIKSST